jgi:glycosyltransferase involved in cell wall biosynthesis
LEELGCEVVSINAEIPRGGTVTRLLGRNWADQAASNSVAAAVALTARLRLKKAGRVDGVVAMGSGYVLSTQVPLVTFEDMTVAQAAREGGAVYERLSDRQVASWKDRQKRFYEAAQACCVASHWAAESIHDEYGIPESKIHVVGFGHNVEMEVPDRSWATPHFLWVGADWERKSGAAIVAAFAEVRRQYPDATLDLVGAHPEVDADGVTGHGRLPLGSPQGQEEYRDLLRHATCYVMPSTNEPLGIVYIDAATAGVPSIGTTRGGARDAIADGGRVVDPGDSKALLQAMLELCDPETARALGERARARSDLYTWRAVAERVLGALGPPQVDVGELASDIEPPAVSQAA